MTGKRQIPGSEGTDEQDFERRLARARKATEIRAPKGMVERTAFGIASRLVVELVAGLVVGIGIGWVLDRIFDTGPVLLIIFFLLGAGAGMVNVVRAAAQIDAAAQRDQNDDKDGSAKE